MPRVRKYRVKSTPLKSDLYTALSTSCSAIVMLSYCPFAPDKAGTARTVSRKRPSVIESTLDLWIIVRCFEGCRVNKTQESPRTYLARAIQCNLEGHFSNSA